jgi:hypothetical protein
VKVDILHLLIGDVWIRIEMPFTYSAEERGGLIDPRDKASLPYLSDLEGAIVRRGIATTGGVLRLDLIDGRSIKVPPHDEFEAWEASSATLPIKKQWTLVALPGGGVDFG